MPYIIDGHNLIPKIPGLSLEDPDDEVQLIEMLLKFCHRQRKQVEVFFDNAPPGEVQVRNYGLVVARFVRQGMTADEAIRVRLGRLERSVRNWTVVSSDQSIRAAARATQARYLSSEAFARLLIQSLDDTRRDKEENGEVFIEPQELDEWLQLFGSEKGE